MFFIDGGYLRKGLEELGFEETHQFQNIQSLARRILNYFMKGLILGEILRIYWYDAEYDSDDERYDSQKEFFDKLRDIDSFEVKTGEIVAILEGDRQKGVDVLIAVDMLTKAYENHYDIAVFVCGDRDFIPLIKAVKDNAGKRVFGAFFERSCSEKLRREFDKYVIMKRTEGTNKLEFN